MYEDEGNPSYLPLMSSLIREVEAESLRVAAMGLHTVHTELALYVLERNLLYVSLLPFTFLASLNDEPS